MRSTLLTLTVLAPLCITSCKKTQPAGDVSFARSTFISLAKGDTDVQSKIDFATLTALGDNVGAKYNLIPTETEKQQFRSLFITEFSSSFRQNGGSVDNFTNWKVTFHDSTRTEVTADSPAGLLKLTVSERDSVDRISSIDMVK